jgi:glucose-1-phosphate adenylyltransferase
MDYKKFINFHLKKKADISISVYPIHYSQAPEFGVMRINASGRITAFYEKPNEPAKLERTKIPEKIFQRYQLNAEGRTHLASMGVYLFNWKILNELLTNTTSEDFGREVIPFAIKRKKVFGYLFDGYWEDIGTIQSFFDAHIELTQPLPKFNLYDEEKPIFSHARFLPGSKILSSEVHNSILCEGSIINRSWINHSIIGIRSRIGENSVIDHSVIMGADFFESKEELALNAEKGIPNMGIGQNCEIRKAIIDKNARIGNGVKLVNARGVREETTEDYIIQDGIIVVPKNAILPDGTAI